jgi:uncharacterized membrane protein
MKPYLTVGLTVLAGAAILEVALVPGVLIGGAAVLAPKLLPGLRRRGPAAATTPREPKSRQDARQQSQGKDGAARDDIFRDILPASFIAANLLPAKLNPANLVPGAIALARLPLKVLPKIEFGQALAKTITFRIIVTTLDFTTNYIVIGELATAAGLSSFNLIAGPLFYFGHEAIWNYLGVRRAAELGVSEPVKPANISIGGISISRALAKTVTFRTMASTADFTVNYLVVGDIPTALILSATGFVLGPFVYYGHEKAWEYFGARRAPASSAPADLKLLPAPG